MITSYGKIPLLCLLQLKASIALSKNKNFVGNVNEIHQNVGSAKPLILLVDFNALIETDNET